MIQIANKKDCSGCSACEAICPKHCIKMDADILGFKYPHVDLTECINCNLCEKVCDFNSDYLKNDNCSSPTFYAARHKNLAELAKSRSGAVFVAISDWIISQDGVIYGAGFKNHFIVTHKRVSDYIGRDELRGSKYVQSDMDGIMEMVANDLKNGFLVLFSGTPCQVAGLKSYIRNKRIVSDKLFLCDIICHGTGSPFIWKEYISYIETKNKKSVISVNFRDKRFGWDSHHETFTFEADKEPIDYHQIFYNDIHFRQSCYCCPFANITRTGDLTLGDFWGWEKAVPDFNIDNLGVSLVMVNTPKGHNLFSLIKNKLDYVETSLENSLQPNLLRPTSKNYFRDAFEQACLDHGYKYALDKYRIIENPLKKMFRKLFFRILD